MARYIYLQFIYSSHYNNAHFTTSVELAEYKAKPGADESRPTAFNESCLLA